MLMVDFREVILEKSNGRTVLPEDRKLYERINVALKRVAKDTVPLKLVRHVDVDNGEQLLFGVLRRIDNRTFIKKPSQPTAEGEDIDIDDELLDAVSYFVIAGLEKANAKTYMGFYHQEIDDNNDRLIETDLSIADNDDTFKNETYP